MLNFDARIKNSDAAQPRVTNVKTPNESGLCRGVTQTLTLVSAPAKNPRVLQKKKKNNVSGRSLESLITNEPDEPSRMTGQIELKLVQFGKGKKSQRTYQAQCKSIMNLFWCRNGLLSEVLLKRDKSGEFPQTP